MPYKDKNDPRNIAYKKAYYERTKQGRYQRNKNAIYKWKEKSKTHLRKYFLENKEQYKKSSCKYRAANKHILNEKERKHAENLSDKYIIKQLQKMGFDSKLIKKDKELIELFRFKLMIKRKLKNGEII